MAKLKTSKSATGGAEYTRYFSNFRGVDFSSEHSGVSDDRAAFLVNMYKDYSSGEGAIIETIPGFRVVNKFDKINGIHVFSDKIFVHTRNELVFAGYIKDGVVYDGNYSQEYDEQDFSEFEEQGVTSEELGFRLNLIKTIKVHDEQQRTHTPGFVYAEDEVTGVQTLKFTELVGTGGGNVRVEYELEPIYTGLTDHRSTSFAFNNTLYILDGAHYIRVSTECIAQDITKIPYIPTTHRFIRNNETDATEMSKWEYEHRNMLTPWYKNTYVPDGESRKFTLMLGVDAGESGRSPALAQPLFPESFNVYVRGKKLPFVYEATSGGQKLYEIPNGYPNAVVELTEDGIVHLVNPPEKSESDVLTIEARKSAKTISGITTKDTSVGSIITNCTIAALFDGRVFLSGNPEYPEHIFWCANNAETGYPDARYFPIVNYELEGISGAPVTAMIAVADSLMVLKRESDIEGSVIFHSAQSTNDPLYPRIYPSTQGLPGRGCLGAACSFLDDPIFISRYGVEAMGTLSVRYERAIEHRSSLIDSKLLNEKLAEASVIEWLGFLCIICNGHIYMADSRSVYTDVSGKLQYDWFYLEDIGVYVDQKPEYVFKRFPAEIDFENGDLADLLGGEIFDEADSVRGSDGELHDLIGTSVEGTVIDYDYNGATFYLKSLPCYNEFGQDTGKTQSYYVEPTGAMIGGHFDPGVLLKKIGDDLYFATAGGYLCKFNFDKRDKSTGLISPEWYSFNGRAIFSGFATKMDNCGIPHLTKNTVRSSTVIKTRCADQSYVKIKIRTNKRGFYQLDRIINGTDTFNESDFESFTFNVDGKNIFTINEREKKWMEKQIFVYTDEICRPFSLSYIAYRYRIAGKYKE